MIFDNKIIIDNKVIFIIGLGPGGKEEISPRAIQALEQSDIIIGYKTYIDFLIPRFNYKKLISFAMKQETERCRQAIDLALAGNKVAIVSSGDAGIYGMAGPMLEIINELDKIGKIDKKIEIEIIPGITAACSAAAVLGAPLTHDFAVVSLSDLLTPWEAIEKRLILATDADFVLCLYNPASRNRKDYLRRACEIIIKVRSENTPTGWVRNAGRKEQTYKILPLSELKYEELDMFCTVIIGNSTTKTMNGRIVTPRGYKYTN